MEPVTLPFGVFAAISALAAYGGIKLTKEIRAGKPPLDEEDMEQVAGIVKTMREFYSKPGGPHLYSVP